MSSFISSSDRVNDAADVSEFVWRRWLAVFCLTFFGLGAVLFVLLLLVDPYDTGRFPTLGIVGIGDHSPRTAAASRGRDPHFNATVIGNSTAQLLNPYQLSQATDLRFTQLSIPGTGPREQLTLMRWVISHHPEYGALIIVTDTSWCSSNRHLPVGYPFPFWLYRSDLGYLANVVSSNTLDRSAYRIEIALGLRRPVDPVGYSDYPVDKNVSFVPGPAETPIDARLQFPPALPWIDRLAGFLAEVPHNVRIVVVVPPVYYTSLPSPGGEQAALLDACKSALSKAVPNRPGSGFLDFRVDMPAVHDSTDFVDTIHYRYKLAHLMEAKIIALLRSKAE